MAYLRFLPFFLSFLAKPTQWELGLAESALIILSGLVVSYDSVFLYANEKIYGIAALRAKAIKTNIVYYTF